MARNDIVEHPSWRPLVPEIKAARLNADIFESWIATVRVLVIYDGRKYFRILIPKEIASFLSLEKGDKLQVAIRRWPIQKSRSSLKELRHPYQSKNDDPAKIQNREQDSPCQPIHERANRRGRISGETARLHNRSLPFASLSAAKSALQQESLVSSESRGLSREKEGDGDNTPVTNAFPLSPSRSLRICSLGKVK